MQPTSLILRGDTINLDALLKASGLVGSGGEAKLLIVGGGVRVNGDVERRRGRKLRAGDEVAVGSSRVRVMTATTPG